MAPPTGRPRDSAAMLAARGSKRATARALEEQTTVGPATTGTTGTVRGRGVPRMPPGLAVVARRTWHRLVKQLDAMGVLSSMDGDSLARYCVGHARWLSVQALLAKHGETYEAKAANGTVLGVCARPEVAIAARLSAELAKLETAFGMTPLARRRLDVTAIFLPGARVEPKRPVPATTPVATPPANVIQGKDRFFGGKPA